MALLAVVIARIFSIPLSFSIGVAPLVSSLAVADGLFVHPSDGAGGR